MAEMDSLNISISASATKASKSIDTLVGKLNTLSDGLNKISGNQLSGLASGVSSLGTAMNTLKGVKASEFNKVANAFKKFGEIDSGKLSAVSSSLTGLASGVNSLASVPELKNVTSIVNALKNLSTANVSGFDTGKFNQIATSVSSFATQLSTVGEIDSKVVRLVGAIARLSNSGQYIGNVATNFPILSKSVETFVRNMARIGGVDANITKLVDGIARLASAGNKTADTARHLDGLGAAVLRLLNNLKSAPQLNTNLANTIQGLGNLAQSGGRVSVATGNASNGTSRLGNALKGLKDRFSSATKSSKGLVSQIGMFYARMFLVIRAIKFLGKSVKSSMDYIETLNYFNAGFGQVAENADLKSYAKMGYKSAEEYYNSFSKRAEQLTQKMSGYKILESGMAVSTDMKSLGIDPSLVMQYQTQFAQMSSSMGVASETAVQLSSTLTRLGADLASVKNLDFKNVWEDMSSGLVGMSRTLDKYGTNIRNVNLQQKAQELGISTSVAKMNQQNKALLRTIILLDSTRYAWGDMAKTINQPANQLRLLQNNWNNLARTVGNIFLPIVAKLLPYLNALVIVLQKAAQAIVNLLGFKDFNWGGASGTGSNTIDFGDALDDSDGIAKNMDKTAKKAKKASDNLQGFDIINKLQDNSDDGSGSGATPDTSLSDLGKMQSALAKLTDEYDKVWNKAFNNMQNKAQKLANRIGKALIDAWEKEDFSELGKALAEWINKGLKKIPWKKIQKYAKKAAKSLATFFNGLFKGLGWKLIGKTLAEGLNTILIWGYNFWTTFDWLSFGKSISDGLNSAIDKFDAELLGKTLAAKLRGVVQFAFGLIETFDFSQLGKKIGDSINAFFTDMGKVDGRTGLTGWQELGKTISDGIKGIATTITTALDTVNWDSVGAAIGQFIGSIDWGGILAKTGELIAKAVFTAIKIGLNAFKEDPVGVSTALVSILGVFFAYKKLSGLWDILKNVFGTGVSNSLTKAAGSSGVVNAAEGLMGKVSSLMKAKGISVSGIVISLTAAIAAVSWAHGQWKKIFDEYTEDEIFDALDEMFKDIFDTLFSLSLPGIVLRGFDKLFGTDFYNTVSKKISSAISAPFKGLATLFSGEYSWSEWGDAIKKFLGQEQEIQATRNENGKAKEYNLKTMLPAYKGATSKASKYSKAVAELNRLLNNGKLKQSEYDKILQSSNKDYDKLYNSVSKLKGKNFALSLKTKVEGKNDVENAKSTLDSLKDKEVTANIKAVADTTNAKNNIDSLTGNRTVTFTATANLETLKEKLSSLKIKPKVSSDLSKTVSDQLKLNPEIKNVTITKNAKGQIAALLKDNEMRVKKIAIQKPKDMKQFEAAFPWAKEINNNKLSPISWYATGGFPDRGQLFLANERGPEMVGKMNNKTTVANQQEIAQGFATAITSTLAPVMYEAFRQAARETMSETGGDVYLDGRKITESVIKHTKQISRQNGKNPIWGIS